MNKQRLFLGSILMLTMVASSASAEIDPVMDNRLSLSARTGFGGAQRFNSGNLHVTVDAAPSIGGALRFERPIHKTFTLGASTAYYASKIKNVLITNSYQHYDHSLELGGFVKARHSFMWTGTPSNRAMEVYLLLPVGATFLFPANLGTLLSDDFAPGWHIGLLPGVQVFIKNNIGILAELGWMHRWSNLREPGPNFKVALDQAVANLGIVFYL